MEFGDGGGQDNDFQNRRGYNQRPKDSAAYAGGGYNQPGCGRPGNDPLGRTESNRTLLDIIREEGDSQKDSRKTWRHFKDKLRRRNSGGRGSTWTSTVTVPTSDIPLNNNNNNSSRMISRHPSTRINSGLESDPMDQPNISAVPDARIPSLNRNPSRAIERASGRFDPSGPSTMKRLHREEKYDHEEDDDEDEGSAAGAAATEDEEESSGGEDDEEDEEDRPVRMSLMSLLAETGDDQMGLGYMMDEEDDDDDDDDGCGAGGAGYNNCCVCMVRHKGTAFVPCGHSFCRLCSRELWVERGNCPLCNNYILEILDIF
ncbi:hypothetical protein ABFS83_14G054500 [Erythranthe nasuta]